MKTYKAVLAALAVISTASAARADLTVDGAVGLPLNPTAQLPPENTWRVQANYFDQGDIIYEGDKEADTKLFNLVGAGRIGRSLEISGGIQKQSADIDTYWDEDDLDKTGFSLGAKYLFTRESDPAGVRLAGGVGYNSAYAKNLYAYLVATKSFGRGITEGRAPITGHLGLRYDRFKQEFFGDDYDSKKVSIYAGLEVPFTRTGDWSFVGELQSKNQDEDTWEDFYGNSYGNPKALYSASIRYRPAGKGFSASVGYARRGVPVIGNDNGWFAQLGYTFGEGEGTENEGEAAVTTTTTTTVTQ